MNIKTITFDADVYQLVPKVATDEMYLARAKLAHDCACATQPANEPKQSPFEQIQAVIQKDSEYAWSWHCNIAMSIYDAGLVDHARANHCAAEVMRRLFGVEPVRPLPELKQPTNVLDSMLRRNALIIANARRLIRDKRMSNSRLYAELFGTGMGTAIKRCDEMSLCPESNKTSYSEMINEIDAQVQAQSCATPANDEPVGVARTNAMLKQGDTFCVFELGSVPEGTKLYTRPQPETVSPKVAPTVAIDERAEFEKWANKHKGGDPLKANENGSYPNPFANAAYEAWQAARKLSAPEVVSKTTDTVVPDAKDEIDHDGIWTNSDVAEQRYIQGWNDCRAAMQANCDAMLKGEK